MALPKCLPNLNIPNPLVDRYLRDGCGRCELGGTPQCKVNRWTRELKRLRQIAMDCGLSEELKWGVPCYTFDRHNIAIVSAFKEFCSISFVKGVLLQDAMGILQKPGENTQSARLIKFTNVEDVEAKSTFLRDYLREAIEIEKQGMKPAFPSKSELVFPPELEAKFDEMPALKEAFLSLTPGRQRGYVLHFNAAKQSKTRASRIEKCIQPILDGLGFHD